MLEYNFDTVILGGGPAGLAAGIYASRGAVSTAIVDINMGSVHFQLVPWSDLYFSRSIGPFLCSRY